MRTPLQCQLLDGTRRKEHSGSGSSRRTPQPSASICTGATSAEESERQALNLMVMHVGLIIGWPEVVREWAARLDQDVPAGFASAKTASEAAGTLALAT